MNKCCKVAQDYIENIHVTDCEELQLFINKFNQVIEHYSHNGLSSFLLSSIELCLKLSRAIGYDQGEAKTKWLKGHVLFMGGLYDLAIKSYAYAVKLLNKDDSDIASLYSSYALNLLCSGEFEKPLELIQLLINNGYNNQANYILSYILQYKGEAGLALSIIENVDENDRNNNVRKISILLELHQTYEANELLCHVTKGGEFSLFKSAYLYSIESLIKAKSGAVVELDKLEVAIARLSRKKKFLDYIEGLLNIAEVYILLDMTNRASDILNMIECNKKDLVILDYRLFKLLELIKLKQGDEKSAITYRNLVNNILEDRKSINIDLL